MQQAIKYGKMKYGSAYDIFEIRFKLLFKDQCLVSYDQK